MQKNFQVIFRIDAATDAWLRKRYEDTGVLTSEFLRRLIAAEKAKAESVQPCKA